MSKLLENWINEDLTQLKAIPKSQMDSEKFFRDPARSIFIDTDLIFSPADGTILYQKQVMADEEIIEVKGKNFTLQNLMQNPTFNKQCFVIGIFLNQFDCHILRLPYSGFVSYRRLEKISTANMPMLPEELDILKGVINYNDMGYVFENERFLYEVFNNVLTYKYYMVAIADQEIDVIANFYESGKYCLQNQRIAGIRAGSQVDLILPIDKRFSFQTLIPDYYHVEGTNDILVKIEKLDEQKVEKRWQVQSGKWHDYDKNRNIIEVPAPSKDEPETKDPDKLIDVRHINVESAIREPSPEQPGGWAKVSGVDRKEFDNPEVYDRINHMSSDELDQLFQYIKLDSEGDLGENLRNFTKLTYEGLDILINNAIKKES